MNLAPADLPKDGGRFDLPIALGILLASGQLGRVDTGKLEFIGELALSGRLNPVPALLPAALACARTGHTLVVPPDNADEAALAGARTLAPASLAALCAHLRGAEPLPRTHRRRWRPRPGRPALPGRRARPTGRQAGAGDRAAGGHSLLLCGPPGAGKSLLAARLPGLLPPLTRDQALEVAAVHSLRSARPASAFLTRPYRSPHHTISATALVGGGGARAREISWPTRACCSWTSCRNSAARCWKCCASPWKPARCTSPAPPSNCASRPAFSWWRP